MSAVWSQLQQTTMLDIPATRWLLSVLVLFATVLAQRYLVRIFHALSERIASRTATKIDDVVLNASEKPVGWLVLVLGIMASLATLNPPEANFPLVSVAYQAGRIITIIVGGWFLWRLIDGAAAYFAARASQTRSPLDDQLIPFIAKTLKIFLIITFVLLAAQNMGYSISGLIASLGIGGIAVAMAARDTIANVFGSIMILIDRPFTIGDWVKTTEFEGIVEDVGFRSTRIRTFAKTLVVVPNSQLANMVIDNIAARHRRRVDMRIGITYATTPAQMREAIAGIEDILKHHTGVDQEFSLVKFDEFADSSLSIFLYYFTLTTNWNQYLQVRQEINLQIMDLLADLDLEFAFPSRTVYLRQED